MGPQGKSDPLLHIVPRNDPTVLDLRNRLLLEVRLIGKLNLREAESGAAVGDGSTPQNCQVVPITLLGGSHEFGGYAPSS
jgi:hypothetical protein